MDLGAGVTRDEGEDTEGKLSMKYDYVWENEKGT